MANYPWSIRFPRNSELQRLYPNQTSSSTYKKFTLALCRKAGITIGELINASIEYLQSQRHQGVEDLAVFMCFLIQKFRLDYPLDSQTLYKAVKGIPCYSGDRIGYTFERRESGNDRGVFLFLR